MKQIVRGIFVIAVAAAVCHGASARPLQDASQAPAAPTRFVGAITAIQGNSVTLKTDAGVEATVVVGDSTRMLQTLPGQKDLSGATPIHLADLEVGDRILARGTPAPDGKSYAASSIIAIKQADLAQKQQQDRENWQKSGEGGLVKSVDPAAQTVTISVVSASGPKMVIIRTAPATILRRYAPDSIEFKDARPAPFSDIKAGDQLRARGTRSADGGELQAAEIVSGTFRNVVATVISVDAANGTLTARDLVAKAPVTIKVTQDSQLRKIPAMMAQAIAMRLKGGQPQGNAGAAGGQGSGGYSGSHASAPGTAGPGTPGQAPQGTDAAGSGQWRGQGGGGTGAGTGEHRSGDLQQALSRAPEIHLSDLQKGDAIMVVTTEGSAAAPATIVTLLAGVEPMLQASASGSQSMLSSSWNLNGGAGGEGEGGMATP